MRLRAALFVFVLAGSNIAPGQEGFIIHFDDQQAGRNGRAVAIRPVTSGFLVFTSQFSQEFPGNQHIYNRTIGADGLFQQEQEFIVGLNRGFDIGYLDAIATDTGNTFTAIIDEGRDFASRKLLYRFNAQGDTLERQLLITHPPEDSILQAIRQVRKAAEGYLFCGFDDPPDVLARTWLGRLDSNGDTLWTKRYGGSSEITEALGVCEAEDGSIYLTGFALWQGVINSSFLIHTDADGNELWRRNYGNRAAVNGAVRMASDGNILTWSEYREPDWPNWYWQQMMLTKWDPAGNIIWQQRSHYNDYVNTFDFEVLPDGSIIATGTSMLEAVLAKFSSTGDSLWSRSYTPTDGGCYLYDVQPTSDGGFVATGTAYWYDQPPEIQTSQLIWVLKTDSLGCVVPGCQNVGVQEYALELNGHLRVWPNPAGELLQLELTIPANAAVQGAVRAFLQDAQGRQVDAWPVPHHGDALRSARTLHGLAPGTYYLHLVDERRWLAGKAVVKE